jgi:hypothetical protein
VSDIFHEVDEEVRQERLAKWWKKYGDYVVAGVSILVIGVAGWKYWQYYDQKERLKASSEIEAVQLIAQAGQDDIAADQYAKIAKKAPSGYALLAQLSQADELLAAGRTGDAVALYMKIAANNKAGLGSVARIRAAWAQGDKLSTPELTALLAPLNDGKSKWRYMARELLAYRALKEDRLDEAQKEFSALAAAADAPPSLRQRAEAFAALIRTSGGKDFGTVPEKKAEAPAASPQPATAEGTKKK